MVTSVAAHYHPRKSQIGRRKAWWCQTADVLTWASGSAFTVKLRLQQRRLNANAQRLRASPSLGREEARAAVFCTASRVCFGR